jgi:hypothetical protein
VPRATDHRVHDVLALPNEAHLHLPKQGGIIHLSIDK